MPFSNPIVGGAGALIRPAIQSPDYVPGSSGWAIKRDGTVEFGSGTFRGDITGATGAFAGTLSASQITAGTLSATMGITGKIRTAAAGARVELDAAGLRAYNAGGTNTVNVDASTGNATVQGDFATGAAGGSSAYLTMNDSTDRSTIALWNAAGTNNAYINSPQDAGVPTVGANTGLYDITGGGVQGRGRLYMRRNRITLEQVRESDQAAYGARVDLAGTVGRFHSVIAGGVRTGGAVYVDGGQVIIGYEVAGVRQSGILYQTDGVHSDGTFVSDAAWSASPAANFTLQEFALDRWGMWVFVHLWVRRTTSTLVAPADFDIGATTLASITSAGNLPKAGSTRISMGGNAKAMGGCTLTSSGNVVLQTLTKDLLVGDDFFVQFNYSQ